MTKTADDYVDLFENIAKIHTKLDIGQSAILSCADMYQDGSYEYGESVRLAAVKAKNAIRALRKALTDEVNRASDNFDSLIKQGSR